VARIGRGAAVGGAVIYLVEIPTWRDYPGILAAAHFAVVSRPGSSVDALPYRLPNLASKMVRRPFDVARDAGTLIFLIDAPTADVSSSAIRDKRAAAQTIDGLVPPLVQQYVEQHGLYGPKVPGRRASDAPASASAGRLHGSE
jgi:nicotinate-nucleotide adenylyltransferase